MMITRKHSWLAAPILCACLACGDRNNATSDSAGGTMAMGDSAAAAGGTMAGDSNMTGTQNNAGMTDGSMAQLIAVVNRGEVQAGTLASTKARNADVKAFAREMVTEHRTAQRKLDSIAKPAGWMVDSASIASGMGMSGGNTSGSTTGGTGTSSNNAGGTGATGGSGTGGTGSTGTAGTAGAAAGGSMSATNQAGDSRLNTMMQQMQQTQMTAMQQLRSATGAEFDRSYMDSQLAGHQQVLDMLSQYMNSVQSNELRTYVTEIRDSVQKHRERAEQIRQKLGSS